MGVVIVSEENTWA